MAYSVFLLGFRYGVCLLARGVQGTYYVELLASSLSDLRLIYCEKAGFGHISRISSLNSQLFASKTREICLKPVFSSLRSLKSDRLLGSVDVSFAAAFGPVLGLNKEKIATWYAYHERFLTFVPRQKGAKTRRAEPENGHSLRYAPRQ
jgi:hypothetical protein